MTVPQQKASLLEYPADGEEKKSPEVSSSCSLCIFESVLTGRLTRTDDLFPQVHHLCQLQCSECPKGDDREPTCVSARFSSHHSGAPSGDHRHRRRSATAKKPLNAPCLQQKNKALPPSIHPVRRSPSLLFPNDTTTSSVLPLTHVLQPQCPPLDVPLIERPQPMTTDGISSLHFHFHPFFSQVLALDELQGTARLVLRATRSPPLRQPIL